MTQADLSNLVIEDHRTSARVGFLKYARGRVAHFVMRQFLTAIGAASVAFFVSVKLGALCVFLALLGEGIDCYLLSRSYRSVTAGGDIRYASWRASLTAGLQSLTISACVLLAWFTPPVGMSTSFAIAFLAAAGLNAGLVWPYHRASAQVRLAIYGITGVVGFVGELWRSDWSDQRFWFDTMSITLLGYMVYVVLTFVVRSYYRSVGDARRILASAKELQEANEQALATQAEARRLALVAKYANDSVIITDSRRQIIWTNDAFHKITGYSEAESVGNTPSELLNGPDTSEETVAEIGRALGEGQPYRTEILNCCKSGREIWMDANLVPILSEDGAVEMVISIERDITDLKLHEEQMARAMKAAEHGERAKSEFLANMSHEIRTPMNGIIGLSDLLSECDLDDEARSYAATIQASAQSLLAIINDILDFSKLDANQMIIDPVEYDLRGCINDCLRLFEKQAADKGLFLDVVEDAVLPTRVVGDDGRLRQVLVNLIGNALKFTHSGGITIKPSVTTEDGRLRLRLEVSDTGIGIPQDRLDHIFDKFSQADSKTTREYGGTGLGLAISRLLARRMGGDITVRSCEEKGSTFVATMMLDAPSGDVQEAHAAVLDPGVITTGLNVLVAEDNKTNRFLIRKYLKDLDIILRFAENGQEAVDLARDIAPDVVFMDMSMPVMDGLEATRHIRKEQRAQPRIIALTANAFASDKAACLEAGMDDFLAKPVRKTDLIAKLMQFQPPVVSNPL